MQVRTDVMELARIVLHAAGFDGSMLLQHSANALFCLKSVTAVALAG